MKKRILLFLTALIILTASLMPEPLGGIFPVEASAKASASQKKKAAKAYRNFMRQSDYTRFCMMDVNKDGLKELVVSYDYQSDPERLFIYTYQKGRVQQAGQDYTAFGHRYNTKTKRIHGLWGGAGSVEDWYLTMDKSGKLKTVYLSMIEKRVVNGKQIFSYSYGNKKITKKAYWKKKRDWNKHYTKLKMHKTTAKNINKYIR